MTFCICVLRPGGSLTLCILRSADLEAAGVPGTAGQSGWAIGRSGESSSHDLDAGCGAEIGADHPQRIDQHAAADPEAVARPRRVGRLARRRRPRWCSRSRGPVTRVAQCSSFIGPEPQAAITANSLGALVDQRPGQLGEADVVAGDQADAEPGQLHHDRRGARGRPARTRGRRRSRTGGSSGRPPRSQPAAPMATAVL